MCAACSGIKCCAIKAKCCKTQNSTKSTSRHVAVAVVAVAVVDDDNDDEMDEEGGFVNVVMVQFFEIVIVSPPLSGLS